MSMCLALMRHLRTCGGLHDGRFSVKDVVIVGFLYKSVRVKMFVTYLEKEGGRIVTLVDMTWWCSASIRHRDCGKSIVNATLLVECLDCRSLALHIHRMVHRVVNSQLLVKSGGTIPFHHSETGLLLSIDF